jgi:hypothetical protein
MSFIAAAVISGGAALAGAGLGYFGSKSASSQQVAAQQAALSQQQGFFNTAEGALKPYYSSGPQYGNLLSSLLTPGPNQTATLSQLPGFQFAQDWGQKAVQNIGTTTGLGGNTLTAGANFATGEAQQGFGSLVNPILQMYGLGASAAGALSGAAQNFSGQASSTLTGIGNSQAAGTLGATNALTGGLTGASNSYFNSLLFNKFFGNGANGNGNGIYGNPSGPQNLTSSANAVS